MKRAKNILKLILFILTAVLIGFIVFSWSRLSGDTVKIGNYAGTDYDTYPTQYRLQFSLSGAQLLSSEGQLIFETVTAKGNMIELSSAGEIYYFIVIDKSRLYCSKLNEYFYLKVNNV